MQHQFQGNWRLFLRNTLMYLALMVPIVSLCLMGPLWGRICTSVLALSIIPLSVVTVLVARYDRLIVDGQGNVFRRPGRSPLPLSDVLTLELQNTSGMLRVVACSGRFRRTTLLAAVDQQECERLVDVLGGSIPGLKISTVELADWKAIAVVCSLFMVLACGAQIYYAERRLSLGDVPVLSQGSQDDGMGNGLSYRAGIFTYNIPPRFRARNAEADLISYFEDEQSQTTGIQVSAGDMTADKDALRHALWWMTGTGDQPHLLRQVFVARYGIIPLVLTDAALLGLQNVSVRIVECCGYSGVIVSARKHGLEQTDIMLSSDRDKGTLRMVVSATQPIDESLLRSLLSGIRLSDNPACATTS